MSAICLAGHPFRGLRALVDAGRSTEDLWARGAESRLRELVAEVVQVGACAGLLAGCAIDPWWRGHLVVGVIVIIVIAWGASIE